MKYYVRSLVLGLLTFAAVTSSFPQQEPASPWPGPVKGSMAQVNITPPIGARLAGHFYETLSTGVHDSLWAKAVILQQGKEKFAFVFCDLIGLNMKVSAPARSQASAQTGIPVKNIIIAATHSHTGPLFYGFQHDYFHDKAVSEKGADPQEEVDYSKFLVGQIVKVIVEANKNIRPVQIEAGKAVQSSLSFNRRYYMKDGTVLFNPGPLNPNVAGPAGPIDPEVGILLLKNPKSTAYEGGLTVFAMHADCIGGTEMSADYPYYLEQTLKGKFGKNFISAFALGAAGDINDVDIKKDQPIYSDSNTEKIGKTLAATVINRLPELKTVARPSLAMLSEKISLPLQVPSQEQIDSARILIDNLYKVRSTGMYLQNAGGESGDFLKRVEMSKYLSLKDRKPTVEVEVQVFRINSETAIVGLPGELFASLGLMIKKRSPFKNTIVMTVCNDKTSYIPTKRAFKEGSYEVTNSILKPGSGEMLAETALKLLKEIKK